LALTVIWTPFSEDDWEKWTDDRCLSITGVGRACEWRCDVII